ncbi:hypothetical protein [Antrihabitans sp. YC2-6]|uniref:hypothetical protein n=1 Tax=Antrihabitans sp. YC2-6 TaxID=2799498 RepID=UPI0018F397F6|nr:hypothetical protein [Antrihabitans sp. YC2-6]MBJ8346219.1 hypothetical protein [Antrihabitans sp. YC2-6]
MAKASEKNYLQLMGDLPALRARRPDTVRTYDATALADLDREISEHEIEIVRRNRHGR